jgi:trk system potassium uptake protein TrkH
MRRGQPGLSRDGWLAGLLLALAPIPPVLHEAVANVPPSGWRWGPIGGATGLLALAGLLLLATKSGARFLATVGILLAVATFGVQLVSRPGPAFFVGILVMAILTRLWSDPPIDDPRPDALSLAKGALLPSILVWFIVGPAEIAADRISITCALVTAGLTQLFAVAALVRGAVRAPRIYFAAPLAILVLAAGTIRLQHEDALASAPLVVLVLVLFARKRETTAPTSESIWEQVLANPAPMLVATFFLLSTSGTLMLWFPVSSAAGGEDIAFIDALFTAVSASCVTGLTVLDTPNDFSGFGHVVIIVLIQVGGLGIMTFSTAALALLRRRASLRHERALADLMGAEGRQETIQAVRQIIAVTATVELTSASVLALRFIQRGEEIPSAMWRGLFTAVSAFCNAGFALQSDNLVSYVGDPIVIHTVALTVILGGLGPPLIIALPTLFRGRTPSTHQYLALYTTLVLLVIPPVIIAAIEWNVSLQGLPIIDKIHNAWFQSVVTRTAGFNSVDATALHPATQVLMMVLMFVGGSPGSTAGGIRTTTFAVLVLAALSVIRGTSYAVVNQRRISHRTVYRALAVTTCGLIMIGVASLALLLTQDIRPLSVLFEVVSAIGTVGLTVGATPQLDAVGKLIVSLTMFAGRVGPLTLLFLLRESESGPRWTFPEENVPVG